MLLAASSPMLFFISHSQFPKRSPIKPILPLKRMAYHMPESDKPRDFGIHTRELGDSCARSWRVIPPSDSDTPPVATRKGARRCMSTIRSSESLPTVWRHCVVSLRVSLPFVLSSVCALAGRHATHRLTEPFGERPPPCAILSGGTRVQTAASHTNIPWGGV